MPTPLPSSYPYVLFTLGLADTPAKDTPAPESPDDRHLVERAPMTSDETNAGPAEAVDSEAVRMVHAAEAVRACFSPYMPEIGARNEQALASGFHPLPGHLRCDPA